MRRAKSCPFCGERPTLVPENPAREGNAWGAVQCENTECPTYDDCDGHGVRIEDGELIADERGTAAYIDAAVKRWNKRHK